MTKTSKVSVSIFIVSLLVVIWSFGIEPSLLVQRNINLSRWPGPPLRIAFFSDLHAGSPHVSEDYIERLIRKINLLSPDLVLIGGDLVINGVVGGTFAPIEKLAPLLKQLKAPLGIYAVLGNHDWWNDGKNIISTLEKSGIEVLENKAKLISVNSEFHFWLVGIGDDFTKHADGKTALSAVNSDAPRILFMHDPGALLDIKEKFFLTLAGHLHGGQVYVPGIGAIITPGRAPKEWAGGWTDFELGSLFVSKGIGTSILPLRFNALPEFVILELK